MKHSSLYKIIFEGVEEENRELVKGLSFDDIKDLSLDALGVLNMSNRSAEVNQHSIMVDDNMVTFGYHIKMLDSAWEGDIYFEVYSTTGDIKSIKVVEGKESIKDMPLDVAISLEKIVDWVVHEIKNLIQLGMFAEFM